MILDYIASNIIYIMFEQGESSSESHTVVMEWEEWQVVDLEAVAHIAHALAFSTHVRHHHDLPDFIYAFKLYTVL